jgi:hypothetical protein
MKFTMIGQEKKQPFNTVDCWIEVTSQAGLTVSIIFMKDYNYVVTILWLDCSVFSPLIQAPMC